ncbi:MAG: hypothetical protein ABI480_04050 [Chitinophagaceae bacterium]
MKFIFLLSAFSLLSVPQQNCNNKNQKNNEPVKYKGRLETKALCMNYTLTLTEGTLDTSMVASSWTDENTGKSYKNAFALGNPCNFPASIQQGDEFYFMVDTSKQQSQCIVCMAYYPTPPKKLFIKVVDK